MLRAIAEILDPIRPWQRWNAGRVPFTHALAVNVWQLMIVAVLIRGVVWILEAV